MSYLKDSQEGSFSELLKIIQKAYSEDEEIILMGKFREALGIDYPHTFKKNQAGDAHTFYNWLHQTFTQNKQGTEDICEIVQDTFQIELIKFKFGHDSIHDDTCKFYRKYLLIITTKIAII